MRIVMQICRVGGLVLAIALCGCTSTNEWIHNGFKVGPNYTTPDAPVAAEWIDANDPRVRSVPTEASDWWKVFNDPRLDDFIQTAYRQNLPLKEAGCRILMARAQWGIAAGNLLPQQQQAFADYSRNAISRNSVNQFSSSRRFFDLWDGGFNLSWELDFWGRLRRSIEAADAQLCASVDDYDAVQVLLVADVARSYAQIRTLQTQLHLARVNVELQQKTLELANIRFEKGVVTKLDVEQAKANLAQTETLIPPLQISLRQTCNQLCVLLGIPIEDLQQKLGKGPIPTAPTEVAVGIPADLLRRRPDVRRSERRLAAQCEQIGIAAAQLYPQLSIVGQIGVGASQFANLDKSDSLFGGIGPSLRWDVMNYGRNLNRIQIQDAHFRELLWNYRNKVLVANQEVENGLATFLYSREEISSQARAVDASRKSVDLVLIQYRDGIVDFNRVFLLERDLVQQEIQLAQSQANMVLGLIEVYRALGGGWQTSFTEPMELVEEIPRPDGVIVMPPVVDDADLASPLLPE